MKTRPLNESKNTETVVWKLLHDIVILKREQKY